MSFIRSESQRFSLVSTTDNYGQTPLYDTASTQDSTYNAVPRKQDPNQLLTLPAPLSVSRMSPTAPSNSSGGVSRSSEEGGYGSDVGSGNQRLLNSQEGYAYTEEYDPSPPSQYTQQPQVSPFEARVTRTVSANNGVLRQPTANQYTVEAQQTYNPYAYAQPTNYNDHQVPYTAEPEELPAAHSAQTTSAERHRSRGISLADNGPVPTSSGVRRVSRQPNRRQTAQAQPAQNRYSRNSQSQYTLPPGAAPSQHGYGY